MILNLKQRKLITMSSSRFVSLLATSSAFLLVLQTALGAGPLFHFCLNTGNFSANDPYESNLNKLTAYLSVQTPPSGFGKGTTGGEKPSELAYGLALCRGDATTQDCKTCVVEAGGEIRKRCPYQKGAIIWYDNCLLKYSNVEFFGQIDNRNAFYMWNLNVVSDPATFNTKTKELLSRLANEAYASPKLYATGELQLYESQKLYGLTQCTRDLSASDCKKCLDDIIGDLPSCCDGKEGGRVVSGSCNFRYEIYPFVNA